MLLVMVPWAGDPLSITACVAGVVSLGLTVCSDLLEYYGSWKDSTSDVSTLCESLEALTKTFEALDKEVRHLLLDRESVDIGTESIISCAGGIQDLKSKIRNVRPGMRAHLQQAQYPFRQKMLAKLYHKISDLRSNLDLAVSTLQLDVSITSSHQLSELDTQIKIFVDTLEESTTKVLDSISNLCLNQEQEKLRSISTSSALV
jgi:Fungal N-terminal domain of STAND proteins